MSVDMIEKKCCKEEPLVSIITVCYNSEDTIERTIRSVFDQSYTNIEYIIIDGNSTDGTKPIITRYIAEKKPIIFVSEQDKGIYDAMNKGINLAHGELIGIINSDDWYEEDAVEKVVNKYIWLNNRDVIIYGMLRLFQNKVEHSCTFYHHNFLPETMINHPACFVSKDIYLKYGIFDITYKAAADYDFMLRVYYKSCEKKEEVFYPIYDVIANFTLGGTSSSETAVSENDTVKYRFGIMNKGRYYKRKVGRKVKKILHYY